VALLVAGALLVGSAPALSITEEEVEQARAEREAAAAERAAALGDLETAITRYEEINSEYQDLTYRIGRLRASIEDHEDMIEDLREEVRAAAVQAYMEGSTRGTGIRAFDGDRALQEEIAREILSDAVSVESEALTDLEAVSGEMDRLSEQLAQDSGRLAELRIEAEAVAARMEEFFRAAEQDLAVADADLQTAEAALAEQRRIEEEERLRREREEQARRQREEALRLALASPAHLGVPDSVTPGFLCPVAGPSAFVDSWGAPRSGGRVHVGVDMMALEWTPLVAVASGTIQMSTQNLGGNVVWLYADHGVNYFYAHLVDWPDGLVNGQWVERGQVIGYVGDTGNPAPGAYHLHFSIYPGGVAAVNPYPTVARHCN